MKMPFHMGGSWNLDGPLPAEGQSRWTHCPQGHIRAASSSLMRKSVPSCLCACLHVCTYVCNCLCVHVHTRVWPSNQ